MDVITVLDELSVELRSLEDLKVDLAFRAEFLKNRIEPLPRPPEQLAKLVNGDTTFVLVDAVVSLTVQSSPDEFRGSLVSQVSHLAFHLL
jgi:hypothetical protein